MKISLKAARVNANLKLLEAADYLGVSRSTLSNYESGNTYPTPNIIAKMENLYSCKYDDIIFLSKKSN